MRGSREEDAQQEEDEIKRGEKEERALLDLAAFNS